jgi:hypothetical protein
MILHVLLLLLARADEKAAHPASCPADHREDEGTALLQLRNAAVSGNFAEIDRDGSSLLSDGAELSRSNRTMGGRLVESKDKPWWKADGLVLPCPPSLACPRSKGNCAKMANRDCNIICCGGINTKCVDRCVKDVCGRLPAWYSYKDFRNIHKCINQEMKDILMHCKKQCSGKGKGGGRSPAPAPAAEALDGPSPAPAPAAEVLGTLGGWTLGAKGKSCDQTCGVGNSDTDMMNALTTEEKLGAAMKVAGHTCKSFHDPRDFAGTPFSKTSGYSAWRGDCAPLIEGSTVDTSANKRKSNRALCYCKSDSNTDEWPSEPDEADGLEELEGADEADEADEADGLEEPEEADGLEEPVEMDEADEADEADEPFEGTEEDNFFEGATYEQISSGHKACKSWKNKAKKISSREACEEQAKTNFHDVYSWAPDVKKCYSSYVCGGYFPQESKDLWETYQRKITDEEKAYVPRVPPKCENQKKGMTECTGRYGAYPFQKYEVENIIRGEKRPLLVSAFAGSCFIKTTKYVAANIKTRFGSAPDVKRFIAFACNGANEDTFGIDCDRIATCGYSNGGMAAMVAANELGKAKGVQAVVTKNGHNMITPSPDKSDEPSYLMFVGGGDKDFMGKKGPLEKVLKEYGVDYTFKVFKKATHTSGWSKYDKEMKQKIEAFLASHLA